MGGAPKFCGTLSTDGLIRIDCDNYPAHWQEIQLPEEVVLAWKEYRSKKSSRVVSEDVLMGFLHMVNERLTALDKRYAELKLNRTRLEQQVPPLQ